MLWRNMIKYTIGLPLLIVGTLILGMVGFGAWILGDKDILFNVILDLWEPIKQRSII